MGNLSFKRKKYAVGGKINYQEGGEVQGPPHSQGGVEAVDQTGEAVAEIEGEERIFSVEDSKAIEQEARNILQLADQDQFMADEAAKQLGYKVTEMIVRQEQVNPSE
jgi:hypothetical protein